MITAYLLDIGPDGHSHVTPGRITPEVLVDSTSIQFKETPAHSSSDWHNVPIPQYVITLSGVLEFVTRTGETCVIKPGDVLIATDHLGTGHKWRLINDDPWIRAYVIFKTGADFRFVPDVAPNIKI
jgi:quercetin dioxygenase-like cupin family protein